MNLSLDELKLVPKNRDIKGYEDKSEEDLIKTLSVLIRKKNHLWKESKRNQKWFWRIKA